MIVAYIAGSVLAAFFTVVSVQVDKPHIRGWSTAIFTFYLLLSIYGAMRL